MERYSIYFWMYQSRSKDKTKRKRAVRDFSILEEMFQSDKDINKHVFDFAEEGTVGRAIFEDDVDLLQQLLAINPDEGKKQEAYSFFGSWSRKIEYKRSSVERIEFAAFFGSVK